MKQGDPSDMVAQVQEDSEVADESLYPVPVDQSWEMSKTRAAGPRGKFNEERRLVYLEERRRGVPHLTAVRRAGISPTTYDRYSAAVGDAWKKAVAYARDESLDPVRAVRRAAALEREPWAVRAEIGPGLDVRAGGAAGGGVNVEQMNVLSISGGADGIREALGSVIDRLREREAALTDDIIDAEVIE